MKKLMIAAAIVCAAAFAQAATVAWDSNAIKMINPTTMAGGLTEGTAYSANGPKISAAQWAPYGAVAADYIITFYWGEGAGAKTDTVKGSLTSSQFSSGAIATSITSVLFDESAGTAYTYDITLSTNAKDGKGKEWVLVSEQTGLAGSIQTAGDVKFNSGAPSTWTTQAVPEPTSGLLLLLGVAGLALRRRRA